MRTPLSPEILKRVYGRLAGRYDLQHALLTAGSDRRGRRLLVARAVGTDDRVLDCGGGTGGSAILAARRVGPGGQVSCLDLSPAMLAVARRKAAAAGLQWRVSFQVGDMVHLPYADAAFDVVLSSYSLCPLYDPVAGALEMYRVTRPGGRIGIAHSAEPRLSLLRWLAGEIEDWAWHFPGLTMGCRAVTVRPALEAAGGRVVFAARIGVPLWPFEVFVVEKPGFLDGIRPARIIRPPQGTLASSTFPSPFCCRP